MVALNEQLHYPGARPGLQGTRVGRAFRSSELGVLSTDQGTLTTDQYCRSDDIFIDHCSLVIERSAGANDIIYCGYPDNNRVSTDIGTGLNDPESEQYYVRNRTYNPVLGRWIQRDPIGYAGGVNLFEYAAGRSTVVMDPGGLFSGIGDLYQGITNGIGAGIYLAGGQALGIGTAIGSDISTEAHLIAGRAGNYWRSAERALARLEHLPAAALQALARRAYCAHCSGGVAKRQGNYAGLNLGGNVGLFDILGGIGIAGVQAIIICSSRQLAFYMYGGGEVGAGTPVVAGLTFGATGGNGVYQAQGYTGWFIGGQGQGGPVSGGLYRSSDGTVSNWNIGTNYGPGASLTTGGEDYGLLGVVKIGGGPRLCCPGAKEA